MLASGLSPPSSLHSAPVQAGLSLIDAPGILEAPIEQHEKIKHKFCANRVSKLWRFRQLKPALGICGVSDESGYLVEWIERQPAATVDGHHKS